MGNVPVGSIVLWPAHLSVPPGWALFPLKSSEDWWRRLWEIGAGTVSPPIVIVKV